MSLQPRNPPGLTFGLFQTWLAAAAMLLISSCSQKILALLSPSLSWASLTHLKLGQAGGHLYSDHLILLLLLQLWPPELPPFLYVQELRPMMWDLKDVG